MILLEKGIIHASFYPSSKPPTAKGTKTLGLNGKQGKKQQKQQYSNGGRCIVSAKICKRKERH